MSKIECTPVDNIMVWGGVHGKKRMVRGRFSRRPRGEGGPGVPLVRSLQKDQIRAEHGVVEAGIANPGAVKRGVRYVHTNFQRCIVEPEKYRDTYEGQLVKPVLQRSKDRDLLVDMHQLMAASELDFIYMGSRAYPYVLGFASRAHIRTIVVVEGALHAQFLHGVGVDLSRKSERDDVGYWRSLLSTTLQEGLPSSPVEEFTIYTQGDLTANQRDELGVTNHSFSALEEVQGARDLLGVNRPVYAMHPQAMEVVAKVEPHEINTTEDGILRLPTFRSLSR